MPGTDRMSSRLARASVVSIIGMTATTSLSWRRSCSSGARPRSVRSCGPEGWVAGRVHDGGRFGGAVDHRRDDRFGAGVEDLADDAGLVPRHPGDRGGAAAEHALEQPDDVGVVEGTVLQIPLHRRRAWKRPDEVLDLVERHLDGAVPDGAEVPKQGVVLRHPQ